MAHVAPAYDLMPEEIALVTPLLNSSGGAGLGWWRLKDTPAAGHAETLRSSAQLLALDEVVHEAALSQVCALLNGAGVTPLLFKGWAAARNYPHGWMRPYGDFDLVVREREFAAAHRALAAASSRYRGNDFALPLGPRGHCSVDLHARLDPFYGADVPSLFARARPASLPGGTLLVPSPEDHLRLRAIHMFRHGAWRPLWLCDVAAMAEAATEDFDWDICLGDTQVTAEWTAAAVMLAHRLLGARVAHVPRIVRDQCVPAWLEATVLRYWEDPHAGRIMAGGEGPYHDPRAMLRRQWPDAITATIWSGGRPKPGPRLHWKLARSATTITRAVKRRLRLS